MGLLIPLIIIAIIVLVIAWKAIRIVPQATVLIIERLGKFDRVAASGPNMLTPFLDRPRGVNWSGLKHGTVQIDLREQFTDLAPQPVITRDNVTILVDSIIYWQITDPIKAVYEVSDLIGGIIQLTITAMRNVIGELDLDHALTSRDTINSRLRGTLDDATHKWGVKVTRVELKNINPPEDVRITMEKQMTAERNRRAIVLQAEGEKQAAIARAEGEKQAAITRAEGDKQAAILQAEGQAQARLTSVTAEAESIRRISEGITGGQGNPAHYLIMMKYIESLREMSRSNNSKVVFMPIETSSVLSSIGAFKEVFADQGSPEAVPVPRIRQRVE
ncbi:MAG: SPFH/Band 7/PHB domain protein [Acidobacteria bacterium]|nr:SPFH/Band 7/PHB domain protein [Acidobacteriota bacterium]MCI0664580.1 SPFH/Band 7/PHB domain protein [Acidobacteriota bacterium]